ncbi:hypothetical protein CBL_01712 [Carabus blaptoides fortunei]
MSKSLMRDNHIVFHESTAIRRLTLGASAQGALDSTALVLQCFALYLLSFCASARASTSSANERAPAELGRQVCKLGSHELIMRPRSYVQLTDWSPSRTAYGTTSTTLHFSTPPGSWLQLRTGWLRNDDPSVEFSGFYFEVNTRSATGSKG